MKKQNQIHESQINYDVYNALNLVSEDLGAAYLQDGFNPFEENFKISASFVIDRFINSCNAKEFDSPTFIEKGAKETKVAFETSLKNCQNILNAVEKLLSNPKITQAQKQALKKLKNMLLFRIQLLTIYIAKVLKSKNTLLMYKELLALDWNRSIVFEKSYYEIMDVSRAISDFIKLNKTSEKEEAKIKKALHEQQVEENKAIQEQIQNAQASANEPNLENQSDVAIELQTPYEPTIDLIGKHDFITEDEISQNKPKQNDNERSL